MFADSLCKENERGRQGWDARPKSLLVLCVHSPCPVSASTWLVVQGTLPALATPVTHSQPCGPAAWDCPFLGAHNVPASGFCLCLLH